MTARAHRVGRCQFLVAVLAVPFVALIGCRASPVPDRNPAASSHPPTSLTPAPTTTPGPAETDFDREARSLMYRFWSSERGFDLDAVKRAGSLGHTGLIPPLVEITVFSFEDGSKRAIGDALAQLTGKSYGGGYESVRAWYRWLGQQPELKPVAGYEGWKGQIYSEIAPGLAGFLYDGMPARVPTWAVQWGGVDRDGIRPLEDPPVIAGREARYLQPDEVVLGVVVNGEARAYPKRLMNVHELANDVVGGHAITVVL